MSNIQYRIVQTCLKQNGIARTLTPMMLFARVTTFPVWVPILNALKSPINTQTKQINQ